MVHGCTSVTVALKVTLVPEALAVEAMPETQFESPNTGGKNWKEPSKWAVHQFTCFDGEGYDIDGRHQYVYLCAYDGKEYEEVRNDAGLSTEECFRFMVDVASKHKYGINVIYGGSYDANMMLRDVSVPKLMELNSQGTTRWRNWRISLVNRKEFTVTDISMDRRNTCKLWDVIGFFQCGFEKAIADWLDVKDSTIAKGKRARSVFDKGQLDFIITYCKQELLYFETLMQRLWTALNTVGIKLNRWDGAGAAAQSVLQRSGVAEFKGTEEQNAAHYMQARIAYAGGRFELIAPGDYLCPVYNYDINSAYPYAMTLLPVFSGLRECRKKSCTYGPYDLLKIHYEGDYNAAFHPYHHRHDHFAVSYPLRTVGWHYGVEYFASGQVGEVLAHLHWDDDGRRPFAWVRDLYQYRFELKASGDKAEKAVKLAINSLYGKCVQQRGWKPGKKRPMFHQLYWGGWITAYTRSMMYRAMMQHPESVIAVETDGIFCTKQLDLDIGDGLGQWGETRYSEMSYVQSGMYFGITEEGEDVTKYRGLDRGTLTRKMVLDAWEKMQREPEPRKKVRTVKARSTRFRTLGTSLVGARVADWRQWVTDKKEIDLLPTGKRLHSPVCKEPWGRGTHHQTICIQPHDIVSHPYNVLWDNTESRLQHYRDLDELWEESIYEH
jgi:hypothetical protein